MLTAEQFALLADYDVKANPEKVDLDKLKPVKALEIIDFSDNSIYYRDSLGSLCQVSRKILAAKTKLGLGDVITFDADMKAVTLSDVDLSIKAKAASSNSGRSATQGCATNKPFSLF